MANDSASGGPLVPDSAPAPLEGVALATFLQGWVVGITGLPGASVIPRWQAEPPNYPSTPWASVGITKRQRLGMPAFQHVPTAAGGLGEDQLWGQERLTLASSFYDRAVTGQADYYASLLRDGAYVPQNNELLFLNGFGLIDVGDVVTVPSLMKSVWLLRCDVEIILQRVIVRSYPVRSVEQVAGTITTDVGYATTISVSDG